MESIRKWLYKPKRDDKSLLAQFFYADEDLNVVANELDSFDGRKDPERCTALVNQLRQAQDKVLTITNAIMEELIGDERANRDFRVKFPEDVLQDNLAGQLWFGAECLAAGSSIMNKEWESFTMRPLARAVTKTLENVRNLLRDACLKNNTPNGPIKLDTNDLFSEVLLESLKIFDKLFAQFEFHYVGAMVPVKSTQEYELQQLIGVLFSETLHRALTMKLLTQEMIDDCDPALMLTIPRLAIVSGLLVFPDGPLCIDENVEKMSEMFRPFRTLLHKIRELLWILNRREIYMLEKLLCDNEQLEDVKSVSDVNLDFNKDEILDKFYYNFPFGHRAISLIEKDLAKRSSTTVMENVQKNEQITSELLSDTEPSTSGYFIPKNVVRNTIIASSAASPSRRSHSTSLTTSNGHDSLEVISAAAASLSSILNMEPTDTNKTNIDDIESQNDSGICTETTSLDRSPSFDINDSRNCHCASPKIVHRRCQNRNTIPNGHVTNQKRTNKIHKTNLLIRKMAPLENLNRIDVYSSSSSAASSFSSTSTTYEDEIVYSLHISMDNTNKEELRSKYRSSEDLIHRLFVCIAGVADQLQTNFACDLRNILKSVFLMNASDSMESSLSAVIPAKSLEPPSLDASIEYHPSEDEIMENNNEFSVDPNILAQEALFDTNVYFQLPDTGNCPTEFNNRHTTHHYQLDDQSLSALTTDLSRYASLRDDVVNLNDEPARRSRDNHTQHDSRRRNRRRSSSNDKPPMWIPDVQAPKCMNCSLNFNVMKRRHHCRNCGKVFCGKCSSNSVPLPRFGINKPVRVCNRCFLCNLSPLTATIH